jgi:hypothetical protein
MKDPPPSPMQRGVKVVDYSQQAVEMSHNGQRIRRQVESDVPHQTAMAILFLIILSNRYLEFKLYITPLFP